MSRSRTMCPPLAWRIIPANDRRRGERKKVAVDPAPFQSEMRALLGDLFPSTFNGTMRIPNETQNVKLVGKGKPRFPSIPETRTEGGVQPWNIHTPWSNGHNGDIPSHNAHVPGG